MADRSARGFVSRHFSRIGIFVCAFGAAIGLMAAVSGVASAQTATKENPPLKVRCGLKVMLVLDESQSIHAFGATKDVREAATTFVEALLGTGSRLAITAFASTARHGVPQPTGGSGYAEVTNGNIGTFRSWIQNDYNPPENVTIPGFAGATKLSGTTNWQDAFRQVQRSPGGPPNLVVFVTDGLPNTFATDNSPPAFSTAPMGTMENATNAAVIASNAVKAEKARVFAIGVGPDVLGEDAAERLRRVSGRDEGTNPIRDDYTVIKEFDELEANLTKLVARLCGSSLIITKYTSEKHGGPWEQAPGWRFTATLDSPHSWLEPAVGTHHTATLTTNDDGEAGFHWRLPSAETRAALDATKETVKPGFDFVLAECQTHHANGGYTVDVSTTEIPGATLGREEYHTCEVYNAPHRPGGGGGGVTGIPAPAPHLSVSKRMPANARVGDRVPIAITVKNIGHGKAHGVRVHETPPGGARIVAVADHGSIQPDGTVVWKLGSLAPKKSHTVHATMLVTRPGLHLNTAVASARDSYPAFDRVHQRDSRPPRPPSFTG